MALGRPKVGFSAFHFTGAPFDDQALNVVVVDGGGDGQLAGRHQFGQQRVAAAHLRPGRGELLEIRHALGFAHVLDDGCKPVGVAGLDAQLAGKARVQQVFVAGGHFIGLDEVGVVADGEEVEAVGHVMPVLRKGRQRQVLEVRAEEFGEQLLAVQGLHLGAVGFKHVAGKSTGTRFGHRALQHLFGTAAPQQHLDAGLLLESLGDGARIFRVQRGVEAELAFLLRTFQQACVAVGTLVEVELAGPRCAVLRVHRRHALYAQGRRRGGDQAATLKGNDRRHGRVRSCARRQPAGGASFRPGWPHRPGRWPRSAPTRHWSSWCRPRTHRCAG